MGTLGPDMARSSHEGARPASAGRRIIHLLRTGCSSRQRRLPRRRRGRRVFGVALVRHEDRRQSDTMLKRIVPVALFLFAPVSADALEIVESNFQHIETRLGHRFLAASVPPGIVSSPLDADWLELVSSKGAFYSSGDRNGSFLGPADPGSRFALSFDRPICVVGLLLKSEYPADTDRSHFSFLFLDREGEAIEELDRWPARGTTRQAFSAKNSISGFRKVVVDNRDGEAFALREVRALPCAIPVS